MSPSHAQPLLHQNGNGCCNGHTNGNGHCSVHFDDDTYLCCEVQVELLPHRLDRLHQLASKNLALAVACLMYIGVNVTCIVMNSMGDRWMGKGEEWMGKSEGEDGWMNREHTFHLMEFWATFAFSVIQIYSLVFSPRSLGQVYSKPAVLKIVMFCNVVACFISALLVSVSLDSFECPSHELEYTNEITMSFVDIVLLAAVWEQNKGNHFTLVTTIIALVVAIVQLFVYNYWDGPNGGLGEQMAHYFEFFFEIISALISFSFCMDNKKLCDDKVKELLQAHRANKGHPATA